MLRSLLSRRSIALVVVVVLGAAAIPAVAAASTSTPLTWATPCSADLDVASCERLTWIANKMDDPAAAAAPISGTVALDGDALDRLDLVWWGVWIAGGLLLAQLVAVSWRRLFNWGASGGDV